MVEQLFEWCGADANQSEAVKAVTGIFSGQLIKEPGFCQIDAILVASLERFAALFPRGDPSRNFGEANAIGILGAQLLYSFSNELSMRDLAVGCLLYTSPSPRDRG